jgi:hypothetical protein
VGLDGGLPRPTSALKQLAPEPTLRDDMLRVSDFEDLKAPGSFVRSTVFYVKVGIII